MRYVNLHFTYFTYRSVTDIHRMFSAVVYTVAEFAGSAFGAMIAFW